MIRQLSLEYFKAWRDVPGMRLAPMTGLFGANSSGKSNLLQALLLLKQTMESSDRSPPLHLGGERDSVELGTFSDLVWDHARKAEIAIGLRRDLPEALEVSETLRTPLRHYSKARA